MTDIDTTDADAMPLAQPVTLAGLEALLARKRAALAAAREAQGRRPPEDDDDLLFGVPAIDKPWRPEKPRERPRQWGVPPLPAQWRRARREAYDPAGEYRPPESRRMQPLELEPTVEPGGRNLFEQGRG